MLYSQPNLLSSVVVFLISVVCSKLSRIMIGPLPFTSLPIDTARSQPSSMFFPTPAANQYRISSVLLRLSVCIPVLPLLMSPGQ